MGVDLKLRIRAADGFTSTKTFKSLSNGKGKEVSKLVTTSIEQTVAALIGDAVSRTVEQHNRMIIAKTAIFFQRVVSRTPKDEDYKDYYRHVYHKADNDDVWKEWKILYGRGKFITAEQMGLELFDKAEDFNNKTKINKVMNYVINGLFGGDEHFRKRKNRIRSIRIENTHPRFAMLEYGEYENTKVWTSISDGSTRAGHTPVKGNRKGQRKYDMMQGRQPITGKYVHGTVGGYSYQAPMGMLRITQAEMMSMNIEDFDKWFSSNYKRNTKNIKKLPSPEEAKRILKHIGNRKNLSDSDIDAIMSEYKYAMRFEA